MSEPAKKNLLIISHDKIGTSMAGPGIRYHYMAEVLSKDFSVTVGFFDPTYLPGDDFHHSYKVRHIDSHLFEAGFQGAQVVIAHWLSETMLAYCNKNGIYLVFDFYVPGPVENLAGAIFGNKIIKPENDFEYNRSLVMYTKFFENGDLFLVSNRRQMDYWIGFIFGADQIHLSTYKNRPLYDRFIFAPMGIDTSQPTQGKRVVKDNFPGISGSDKLLLWTGGIWNHFDGKVLMEAMSRLAKKRPDIKLLFFGTQHPNTSVPEMKESLDTRQLAKDLGTLDRTVFFKDGWVKYHDRLDYLLEADAAVNTHKASIETEFSHRTRVLDHFWAKLPTISTEGDYLSDEVIRPLQLGIVIPPDNPEALVNAIEEILVPETQVRIRKSLDFHRESFDWHEVLKELRSKLSGNLQKLPVQKAENLPNPRSKPYRYASKALPIGAKKAIIRVLKINK